MTDTSKTETISTPSGKITATTQNVEFVTQVVTVVSAEQTEEFEKSALMGWEFVAAYLGPCANLSLASLDDAFRKWQVEAARQFSEQQVVQVLGAYLGQRLASDLDMEWVTVEDQYGTDYAVRSRKMEVLSFPFSSVSKRVKNSQCDFMVAVYHTVDHTLKNGDHMPRRT